VPRPETDQLTKTFRKDDAKLSDGGCGVIDVKSGGVRISRPISQRPCLIGCWICPSRTCQRRLKLSTTTVSNRARSSGEASAQHRS
jgi:hypothetical protein